jgi:surface antigen
VTRGAGRATLVLLAGLSLAGCEAAGGIAGGVSGVATGIATGNAAVGYAVGVGIRAAVDATVKYVERTIRRGEQDNIAAAAGAAEPGQVVPWKAEHELPFGYGDAEGTVQVVRLIETPLTHCREVAIGVGEKEEHVTLIATACQQSDNRWKWASAESAVERWGVLQ